MTLEEMKAKIAELLANEDRQPKDDAELELLQSQLSAMLAQSEATVDETPKVEEKPVKAESKKKK